MEALDRALINVYSLLIVAIPLIQFGCNAPCKFLGERPQFQENRCLYGVGDGTIG